MQLVRDEVVSIAISIRCCLRDVTYVDVEEGWCQGKSLRDSILEPSQAELTWPSLVLSVELRLVSSSVTN